MRRLQPHPVRHRPVRSALVATAAALVLAACGGGDGGSDDPDASSSAPSSSSAASSDVEPATGDTIEADGFSYTVPEGWEKNTDLQGTAITLALDSTDKDGFADNVNVVTDPTITSLEGDDLADAITNALEQADVTEISVREPFVVDGQEAVHTTGLFNLNGNEYRVDQYTLTVDGTGYVITFSHNADQSESERDDVDHSILASWSWA
ncbi:MAG: hypothetical protein EON53_12815 [Actinomycetales bacterium]|nr:MAG: hypothetical protein EON53_12815 [Actinomycetales bacterium]